MERRPDGTYKKKIKDETIIETVRQKGPRATTGEIAEDYPVTPEAMRLRLHRLHDTGIIELEQVSGNNFWSI